jgi:exportin-2 (importin alpha re-exporter)
MIESQCLEYQNRALETDSDDEPGPIEKLQAAVVENLNLYASKYEEEFAPFLQNFTMSIWALLMRVRAAL